jgi:hypothetical protein
MSVVRQHDLVALELSPGNVAGVMIANQDCPRFPWLKVALALSGAALHHVWIPGHRDGDSEIMVMTVPK